MMSETDEEYMRETDTEDLMETDEEYMRETDTEDMIESDNGGRGNETNSDSNSKSTSPISLSNRQSSSIYQCELCDKTWHSLDSITVHLRKLHNVHEERHRDCYAVITEECSEPVYDFPSQQSPLGIKISAVTSLKQNTNIRKKHISESVTQSENSNDVEPLNEKVKEVNLNSENKGRTLHSPQTLINVNKPLISSMALSSVEHVHSNNSSTSNQDLKNANDICVVCRISLPDLLEHKIKYHTKGLRCELCRAVVYSRVGSKAHRKARHKCRKNVAFEEVDTTILPCSASVLAYLKRVIQESHGKSSISAKKNESRDKILRKSDGVSFITTNEFVGSDRCDVCGISLPDLNEHNIKYHTTAYECEICSVIAYSEVGMKRHKSRIPACSNATYTTVSTSLMPCSSRVRSFIRNSGGKPSVTDTCKSLTNTLLNTESGTVCHVCKISVPDLSLHHVKYHTQGHQCQKCYRIVYTNKEMKRHLQKKHGRRRIPFRTVDTSLHPLGPSFLKIADQSTSGSCGELSSSPTDSLGLTTSTENYCYICKLGLSDVTQHKLKYHTTGQECEICNVITYSEKGMKLHRMRMPACFNATFKTVDTTFVPCSKCAKNAIKLGLKKSGGKLSVVDKSKATTENGVLTSSVSVPANVCGVCKIPVPNLSKHQILYHTLGHQCEKCHSVVYTNLGMKLHKIQKHKHCEVKFKVIDTSFQQCGTRIASEIKRTRDQSIYPPPATRKTSNLKSGANFLRRVNNSKPPAAKSICQICKLYFTGKNHAEMFHSSAHQCILCKLVFYSEASRMSHLSFHFKKPKGDEHIFEIISTADLPCSRVWANCETKLAKKVARLTRRRKSYYCHICSCSVKQSLAIHKKYFHTKAYECKLCRVFIYNLKTRRSHAVQRHGCRIDRVSVGRLFRVLNASLLPCYQNNVSKKCNGISELPEIVSLSSSSDQHDSSVTGSVIQLSESGHYASLSKLTESKWCDLCRTSVDNLNSHFLYAHSSGYRCRLCSVPIMYYQKTAKNHALSHDHNLTNWQEIVEVVNTSNVPMSSPQKEPTGLSILPSLKAQPTPSSLMVSLMNSVDVPMPTLIARPTLSPGPLRSLSNPPPLPRLKPFYLSNNATDFGRFLSNFCTVCKYEVDDLFGHSYHAHSFGWKCKICPDETFLISRNVAVHFFAKHANNSSLWSDSNLSSALNYSVEKPPPDMLSAFTRVDLANVPLAASDCPQNVNYVGNIFNLLAIITGRYMSSY